MMHYFRLKLHNILMNNSQQCLPTELMLRIYIACYLLNELKKGKYEIHILLLHPIHFQEIIEDHD